VLKGKATGSTKLIATEGFVLGGVLQDAAIYQCSTRKTGAPWTTRATGVEMLENSVLKNVGVRYYYTGISSEKTTGIVIDGSAASDNYYGVKFTGGVAATFSGSSQLTYNEVYGLGLFQGPDAIPENKPVNVGTLTMSLNWSAEFVNAWEDEYLVNIVSNYCYGSNQFGLKEFTYYGTLSDFVYERNPDIDFSSQTIYGAIGTYNGVCPQYYLGVSVIKNNANSSNVIRYTSHNLLGVDIDGTVWGTKNRIIWQRGYTDADAVAFYQWNATSIDLDPSWTGSASTPTTSDTWTADQPCPNGWRLPTKAEVEHLIAVTTVSSESHFASNPYGNDVTADCYKYVYKDRTLYMNKAQYIDNTAGMVSGDGYYWTSESSPTDPTKAIAWHGDAIVEMPRAAALMVRCVHKTPQSDGNWQ
jgi:uncharacterized protein (TIGR02145 family)